jgi:hypothetical protein
MRLTARVQGLGRRELDLVAHRAAREAVRSGDVVRPQDRPLLQREGERRAPVGELAARGDVIELPSRVDRLDGALERAIVDRPRNEGGFVAHGRVSRALGTVEDDRVWSGAAAGHRGVLRARRRP